MNIKILDWEKYNPRKDIKNPYWFRLENRIFETLFFSKITATQKAIFLYILCELSKKKTDIIEIKNDRICTFVGCKSAEIDQLVDFMVFYEVCKKVSDSVVSTDAYADVSICAIQDNTTQDNTAQKRGIDFSEKIIQLYHGIYPKKEGKKRGVEILTENIKTEKELLDLESAIKNYAKQKEGSDYIKHFDTFARCWEDYIPSENEKNDTSSVVNKIREQIALRDKQNESNEYDF